MHEEKHTGDEVVSDIGVPRTLVYYRGFEIREYDLPYARLCFGHEDYDGPGDPRCGVGDTVDGCKTEIDEILLDWEEENG